MNVRRQEMITRIVGVSVGYFDPGKLTTVREALEDSYGKLAPGIKSMTGNIDYFVGIDAENNAIVNVSSWKTLSAARQMDHFQPMLDLAREFVGMGVHFDRPILNFEPVWTIDETSN